MKCTKCEQNKHENDILYDPKTLLPICSNCDIAGVGIHSKRMDTYLAENYSDLLELSNKPFSTRLSLSQVFYLVKYSKQHKLSISGTLAAIIDEMIVNKPLHDVDVPLFTEEPKEIPNLKLKKIEELEENNTDGVVTI